MTESLPLPYSAHRRGIPAAGAIVLSILGNILVIAVLAVAAAAGVVAGVVVFGGELLGIA